MDPNIDQAIAEAINRHTEIDYLLVADRVEVVNHKLYMMGGGWDRIQGPEFPFSMMLGIAVGVRVPYSETDDPHKLVIALERADGDKVMEIDAELQTGRPPGSKGMDMLVPMAFNVPLSLPGPGELVLVAGVDGRSGRRHAIRVVKRS